MKIALAALALAAAPAAATSIVDTGTPPAGEGWSLDSSQWLAAKFTAPVSTLTDLTGYIGSEASGSFHVALYTASGGTPGTELFSAMTTSTAILGAFQGVHGVSWAVAAGDYIVAFEVRPGDTLDGYMPHPSITPLGVNAYYNSGGWQEYDPLAIGVKVDGTLGAVGGVPEPASWAFMITGFGMIGVSARRRRTIAL